MWDNADVANPLPVAKGRAEDARQVVSVTRIVFPLELIFLLE